MRERRPTLSISFLVSLHFLVSQTFTTDELPWQLQLRCSIFFLILFLTAFGKTVIYVLVSAVSFCTAPKNFSSSIINPTFWLYSTWKIVDQERRYKAVIKERQLPPIGGKQYDSHPPHFNCHVHFRDRDLWVIWWMSIMFVFIYLHRIWLIKHQCYFNTIILGVHLHVCSWLLVLLKQSRRRNALSPLVQYWTKWADTYWWTTTWALEGNSEMSRYRSIVYNNTKQIEVTLRKCYSIFIKFSWRFYW